MNGDAEKLVKLVAEKTNDRIENYHIETTKSLRTMSDSITKMAEAIQKNGEQLARYEERQNSAHERMERVEGVVRDLGIKQREFEKDATARIMEVRDETKDNSFVRRIAVWVSGAIIAAMIAGGMLFSNITGKVPSGGGVIKGKVQ